MSLVLGEALERFNPSQKDMQIIKESLDDFIFYLNKRIKKLKLDADIFVGGSFSKNTLVKKKVYDIDLFLRYGKKHKEEELNSLSKKILRFTKGVEVIHGSRDYFRIKGFNGHNFFVFEVVPVRRIKKPDEAVNITDLSYLHYNYITKKIKNKKIFDEIKIAKAFCHGTKTYGAETYIKGFSGYSLELLVYYYGGFLKFLKVLSKKSDKKIVVDIEKHYKKGNPLIDMNGSKLDSPVILVDPTYKMRNALAALSQYTFLRFQESARKFLKNPSIEFFIPKKIDFKEVSKKSLKQNYKFIEISLKTKRNRGDVAGAKLLKFFNHISVEFHKYFEVKEKDFEYDEGKNGKGYLVLKPRVEIELRGPFLKDIENSVRFKKEHAKTYEKKGRIYSSLKVDFLPSQFLKSWIKKNKKKIKEMSITSIGVN